MFRNYLTTAWRHLIKNGRFSIINIFALALGLASCILILLFVRAESGYDKWIQHSDRVARLHSAYVMPNRPPFLTVRSAGRMMEAVRDFATAEIEDGVRLIRFPTTVLQDSDAFSEMMTIADGSFFNVIALPFVHGSPETAFSKPNDLVITEEMANKYFGKTDVVGQTLTFCCLQEQTITLPVTGVVKDLPEQTHFDLDFIVRLQPALFENDTNVLHTWTSVNVYTYFKLREGVTVDQAQERLSYWVNNESPFLEMYQQNVGAVEEGVQVTDFMKHTLMPLEDLHLHAKKAAGNMGDLTPMGDFTMIYTFSLVAVLILAIACFNFMNLSTARATQRAREVAMRKVLGASRKQVALQFLSESVALVMIAMLFALVLVEIALPFYSDAIGRNISLALFSDLGFLGILIGLALSVGVLAGSYPAMVLSRFLPSQILKSNKSSESSGSHTFRNALVIMQFAISIVLIICTSVIYTQTQYAQSIDVGYDSDNKMVLGIRAARGQLDSLQQALEAIPGVDSVVYSSEAPTQDNENNRAFKLVDAIEATTNTEPELLNYHTMGYGFFEAYDVAPIAGRLFSEEFGSDSIPAEGEEPRAASAILNMSALGKFGIRDPQQIIGKTLTFDGGAQSLQVIGVIPDIYFRSIKFGVRPSIYFHDPQRFNVATISVNSGNFRQVIEQVEQIWRQAMPSTPINLTFLDEMMAAQYSDEQIQTELFTVFSILAIIIACLGLFGLATFTIQRKTKEIGIRKVMGASVKDIVALLIWQFSKPVIWANLIAWPIAGYAMINWLERFEYRIEFISLLPISIAVGVILLVLAWLTVGGNAAKVARSNPVEALRQE
ncbi:ABC transporter permease [Aliiglaciecola sp. M165]|uniref:ABC transporter permease n=1 Tax=Aliiglaciecola sp. M165 TaxID=2593649 RepID=UPI00117DF1C1|nr:ABC transporter permease [Aliiglaciecola sp. M165]TRY31500.1 FtsX-like permease family protein [Aliiglaciecola sp. M165]